MRTSKKITAMICLTLAMICVFSVCASAVNYGETPGTLGTYYGCAEEKTSKAMLNKSNGKYYPTPHYNVVYRLSKAGTYKIIVKGNCAGSDIQIKKGRPVMVSTDCLSFEITVFDRYGNKSIIYRDRKNNTIKVGAYSTVYITSAYNGWRNGLTTAQYSGGVESFALVKA